MCNVECLGNPNIYTLVQSATYNLFQKGNLADICQCTRGSKCNCQNFIFEGLNSGGFFCFMQKKKTKPQKQPQNKKKNLQSIDIFVLLLESRFSHRKTLAK